MNPRLQAFVSKVTGAYVSFHLEDIQSLWSGYGMIMRYGLKGSAHKTAIVKHVRLADKGSHPWRLGQQRFTPAKNSFL